ncbi:FAD-dependent oxidoreductase [Synechococcus sp. PCC 7336]|uniref:FAD-dependent oxidoreductase n=1 Tax=Synechococcus sp. PCC 7336 TaxID=195250 RepID=UPI0003453F44|nr:FAD-dependent oxidoreductase [Synechococcus sp. PCC 7336]
MECIDIGWQVSLLAGLGLLLTAPLGPPVAAQTDSEPTTVECEVLIAGGGLGGVAAAYDSLRLGQQVCVTEITDWIGGQATAQGVSALDERPLQRGGATGEEHFPSGYSEFRDRIRAAYGGELNPGKCWVSVLCFSPRVGHQVLREMLQPYVESGQLQLFTDTVVASVDTDENLVTSVTAIRHIPTRPELAGGGRGNLSEYFLDWYDPAPSADWDKEEIAFVPPSDRANTAVVPWMVIDATETGELWPLADVPYLLGTDNLAAYWEPSAKSEAATPYCTQGFTYTFVMERTATPQVHIKPDFYDNPEHGRYYSFEQTRFNFANVFTYRRIRGQVAAGSIDNEVQAATIRVGDRSMQNWTWGNDWRISTPDRNFILTPAQLEASGQLEPGGWRGGLRPEALRWGEQHALGYFYWLVVGRTDFLLQDDPEFEKAYHFRHRLMQGADAPMGTASGLSKYPYIRESRRLLGRPGVGYPEGFLIYESDISVEASDLQRGRPFVFTDSLGIGQYPIDFHACVQPEDFSPDPLDIDYEGVILSYPYQIPLRALIPQKIDNLLAGAKNIAATHIAAASYRVHPVEWAIGSAAGNAAAFALAEDVFPASLVEGLPTEFEQLRSLQIQVESLDNPITFPGTSIVETDWADFR